MKYVYLVIKEDDGNGRDVLAVCKSEVIAKVCRAIHEEDGDICSIEMFGVLENEKLICWWKTGKEARA